MNKTFRQRTLPLATALVLGTLAMDTNAQIGYWQDQSGGLVRSGNDTCVRTGYWTPELATAECDPGLVPQQVAAVPDSTNSQDSTSSQIEPRAAVPAPMPATEKVKMDADALFDFDDSEIKPEGKEALDEIVRKLNLAGAELGLIVSTGHTDSIGGVEYNMELSARRAEAVKTYLISKGIDAQDIKTVAMGESQPFADNATAEGRVENRRVEIEVSSMRTTQ